MGLEFLVTGYEKTGIYQKSLETIKQSKSNFYFTNMDIICAELSSYIFIFRGINFFRNFSYYIISTGILSFWLLEPQQQRIGDILGA